MNVGFIIVGFVNNVVGFCRCVKMKIFYFRLNKQVVNEFNKLNKDLMVF